MSDDGNDVQTGSQGFILERNVLEKCLEGRNVVRWQLYLRPKNTIEAWKLKCVYYYEQDVKEEVEIYQSEGNETLVLSISHPWNLLFDHTEEKNIMSYLLSVLMQQCGYDSSNIQFELLENNQVFIYHNGLGDNSLNLSGIYKFITGIEPSLDIITYQEFDEP